MKQKDSLIEGSIWKGLLAFVFPIFLGQVFQQLYNTADALIVGNYLDKNAYAAVSSSGSLVFLLVGFFGGISVGAGVVIARYFGAGDVQKLRVAVHTTVISGAAAGLFLTAAGMLLTPQILKLMVTPTDVMPNSVDYFRMYFAGSMAIVLYNMCVGILRAVGDSKRPLYYLIISSLVNIALDLLFVGALGMGVGSAAAATAISQIISTVLCLYRLTHSERDYRVRLGSIGFDPRALHEILANGVPAGLANSIIAVANVVVQANINAFGAAAMAGCGAHSRIEGFTFLPITCFNMALTTFVSQNLGAKRYDRVKQGVRVGLGCTVALAECIGVLIFIFSPHLIDLFDRNPEVIAYGVMHQRTVALFSFLLAYTHAMAAIFRGAGKSAVPLLVMAVCWCVLRVPYVTLIVRVFPVLRAVSSGYPVTWALSAITFTVLYFRLDWMHDTRPLTKQA